jgi:F0F1-type ATP synthase assembly protein I
MASTDPSSNPKLKQYNAYQKYASLGLQLLVGIGVFGWLGYRLDQYLNFKFPAFMLLFGFAALGGMLYQVYRVIRRDNP